MIKIKNKKIIKFFFSALCIIYIPPANLTIQLIYATKYERGFVINLPLYKLSLKCEVPFKFRFVRKNKKNKKREDFSIKRYTRRVVTIFYYFSCYIFNVFN